MSEKIISRSGFFFLETESVVFFFSQEIADRILMPNFPFQYAIQSQIRYHGYDPAESIVEVVPRKVHTVRLVSFVLSRAK